MSCDLAARADSAANAASAFQELMGLCTAIISQARQAGRPGYWGPTGEAAPGQFQSIVLLFVRSGSLLRNDVALDRGLVERVEIEAILNVQPVLRRGPKVASEARGGVRGDPAFLIDDQADAVRRHPDRLRQPVDADLFVLHVFEQNLARMDRRQLLSAFSGNR